MPSRTDLLFTIAFFAYAILGGWLCVSTDFAWWALALFAAPAVYYAALVVCSASESLMNLLVCGIWLRRRHGPSDPSRQAPVATAKRNPREATDATRGVQLCGGLRRNESCVDAEFALRRYSYGFSFSYGDRRFCYAV